MSRYRTSDNGEGSVCQMMNGRVQKEEKSGNVTKKTITLITAMLLIISSFPGCGQSTVDVQSDGMKKVGSYNVETEVSYTDESEREELQESFSSDDGLCVIDVYPTYYDVTLDYEKGQPKEVGKAYAETILRAVPGFEAAFEPYLHENVRLAFGGRDINYDSLEKRVLTLEAAIPEEYREEIESFAETLSAGEEGYSENGELSYIEVLTMQMIPDALRPTACSALSLTGSKTETGKRMTLRNLEWNLGSESQMTDIHAVVHMKKGDRSLTSIGILGLLDIITAVNDDGLMIAILDVGSEKEDPFIYDGKKCYTYEIRKALEEYSAAKDAGDFLVGESGDFTWCNNILITDSRDAFCAENATAEVAATGRARSVLRDENSELMEGIRWDSPDSLCIVNSFATKGNQDGFTGYDGNVDRFVKYNKWVKETDKFSLADVKGIMAHEVVEQYDIVNVHNDGTVHTVIVDYATGRIHVSFTKGVAEDVPRYIDVGSY